MTSELAEARPLPRANAPKQQLSEDVATYIRELIISGRVKPGDFLRTEPIAEALGVSNTPVREGLLILSGEGFVELVPRRGFVVTAFSRQDVRDIFWAQAELAAELTSRAAKRITPSQIEHLEKITAEHARAVKKKLDSDTVVSLGHEFHRTINIAADARRLALMLGSIVRQLPNRFYNEIEGHGEDTADAHPRILSALRKRHHKAAAALMREHIMSGADELIEMLERQGVWDDTGRSTV